MALHAGGLIYLGTFATANNFDYRLIYLLLTLPQLCEWAGSKGNPRAPLAATTLAAVVMLLWVGSLSRLLRLWDELASWAVAGLWTAVISGTFLHLLRSGMRPDVGMDRRAGGVVRG